MRTKPEIKFRVCLCRNVRTFSRNLRVGAHPLVLFPTYLMHYNCNTCLPALEHIPSTEIPKKDKDMCLICHILKKYLYFLFLSNSKKSK